MSSPVAGQRKSRSRATAREDTVVADGVGAGRGSEGAESSEEGVREHLGVGGPTAAGPLEVHADLAVVGARDGVLSERPRSTEAGRWRRVRSGLAVRVPTLVATFQTCDGTRD